MNTTPIVIEITLNWQAIAAVAFGLLMFGIAFAIWIYGKTDDNDGYLAILVAAGVTVTLVGAAIISWQAALLSFAAFVFTGIPMIVGDIYRFNRIRAEAIKRAQDKANEP